MHRLQLIRDQIIHKDDKTVFFPLVDSVGVEIPDGAKTTLINIA